MAKVLIIGPFHANGMALLEARGDVDFEIVDGRSEAELADKIRDADAATMRTVPLTAAVIDRAERLKVVSRHGVGYDNIDVAALTARGIPLAIAADANATAVAEHTLFFMLALAKQALRHDRAVREGNWEIRNRFETVDLMGRKILVLGYGRIGRECLISLVGVMRRRIELPAHIEKPQDANFIGWAFDGSPVLR